MLTRAPLEPSLLPGIHGLPLRTETLPPATHTNAWIVELGRGGLAVIDPGAHDPAEQARLDRALVTLAANGLTLREIWLTHAHPDHTGGVDALRARHDVPLRAHAEAAARLPPATKAAVHPLADRDLLHGRFRALHTPGHARGHLAFLDESTGALLAGDMISTLSTIVIDPPEGDMADYLRSLERLRALSPRYLYPAHGPSVADATARLTDYLAHRRDREGRIATALSTSPGTPRGLTLEEVTALAYRDIPPAFLPVAARSCLASLEKLRREGRATFDGTRWDTVC